MKNSNDYIAHFNARATIASDAASSIESQIQECDSADEICSLKATQKALQTKSKYLTMLVAKSEAFVTMLVQQRVTEAALLDIEKDSYSLSKLCDTMTAIKAKRAVSFSEDDALAQAIAYLAKHGFNEVTHDQLRKNMFSKKSDFTVAHTTDRQASMICKLFERLGCAERTKLNDQKATKFNVGAPLIKKLIEIYA